MRKNETVFKVDAKQLDTSKYTPPVLDGVWGQGKGAGAASETDRVSSLHCTGVCCEQTEPRSQGNPCFHIADCWYLTEALCA